MEFLPVNSVTIGQQLDKYIGQHFALGNPKLGWDCLNTILDFYGAFGIKFPDEFEEEKLNNYVHIWVTNEKRAREIYGRFLQSLGEKIECGFFARGDLLLFDALKLGTWPGIDMGNGNTFMVWKEGCHPVPFKAFAKYLIGVRRLLNCSTG